MATRESTRRKDDLLWRGVITLLTAGVIGFITMTFTTYVKGEQIIKDVKDLKDSQKAQDIVNKKVVVHDLILKSMVKTLDDIKQSIKTLDNRQRKIHLELKEAINDN